MSATNESKSLEFSSGLDLKTNTNLDELHSLRPPIRVTPDPVIESILGEHNLAKTFFDNKRVLGIDASKFCCHTKKLKEICSCCQGRVKTTNSLETYTGERPFVPSVPLYHFFPDNIVLCIDLYTFQKYYLHQIQRTPVSPISSPNKENQYSEVSSTKTSSSDSTNEDNCLKQQRNNFICSFKPGLSVDNQEKQPIHFTGGVKIQEVQHSGQPNQTKNQPIENLTLGDLIHFDAFNFI